MREDFDIEVEKLLKDEGIYSNDFYDTGRETCYGIARNYYPFWSGWGIIDEIKKHIGDNKYTISDKIKQTPKIRELAKDFYYKEYWQRMHLDKIPDKKLKSYLFNVGVNKGAQRAVMFMQRALNILNKNKKYYKDLVVDGLVGARTINAIRRLIIERKLDGLEWWIETVIRSDYLKSIEKDKKKERYAFGWAHRLKRIFF